MSEPFNKTMLPAFFAPSTVLTTLSSMLFISSPNNLLNSPSCGVSIVCSYVSINSSSGELSKLVIASASMTT